MERDRHVAPEYLEQDQNILDQPPFNTLEMGLKQILLPYIEGDLYEMVIKDALPTIVRVAADCVHLATAVKILRSHGLKIQKSSVAGIRDVVGPYLFEYPYMKEYLQEQWGRDVRKFNADGKRIIGRTDPEGKPLYHIDRVASYAAYAHAIEQLNNQKMYGLYEILPHAATQDTQQALAQGKRHVTRMFSIRKSEYLD